MNKIKTKRNAGVSLAEFLISLSLMGLVFITVVPFSLFMLRSFMASMEAAKMHAQVNYALEDMRNRCFSAAFFHDPFDATTLEPDPVSGKYRDDVFRTLSNTQDLWITGERDINKVTPENDADNVDYHYFVRRNVGGGGGDGALVLRRPGGNDEILISGEYQPQVYISPLFGVTTVDIRNEILREPNYLWVEIRVTNPRDSSGAVEIFTDGINFWYTNTIQ